MAMSKLEAVMDAQLGGTLDRLQTNITTDHPHEPGSVSYDPTAKTIRLDTGFPGVSIQAGQEHQVRFYNDTGATIPNGKAVNAAGFDVTNDVIKGILADSSSLATSASIIGITTHDVPDGTVGAATLLGHVNGVDTSALSAGGITYLGTAGGLTNTRPIYPGNIVIMGSVIKADVDGIILVQPTRYVRPHFPVDWSMNTASLGVGTYDMVGGTLLSSTSITLDNTTPTQPYGTANVAYGMHAMIVSGPAGTVDVGKVGLLVRGTSVLDDGSRTPNDTEILTTDITTLVSGQYIETANNWIGQITFELYVEEGIPTAYSLAFNFGLIHYADFGNRDFTLLDFQVEGLAGAADTDFDVEIYKQSSANWVYAASGFQIPAANLIASLQTDYGPEHNLTVNSLFKWKRDNIDTFINGGVDEGAIVKVTVGSTNSLRYCNIHLNSVVEELV